MARTPDWNFRLTQVEEVGVRAGVRRTELMNLVTEINTVHRSVEKADAVGLLPHTHLARRPGAIQEWGQLGESITTEQVVVFGEPSAAVGAAVLAGAEGRQPICCWGASALEGATDAAHTLVVLDGPPWVRAMAKEVAARFGRVLIFRGDGTPLEPWSVPGATVLEGPGASDPRFSLFGGAAMTLAHWAGADLEALEGGLQQVCASCEAPGLFDNPAYRLAATCALFERLHGLVVPVFLPASDALASLMHWAANTWTALTSGRGSEGGILGPGGAMPYVVRPGDEAATERMVSGESNLWALGVWAADEMSPEQPDPLRGIAGQVHRSQIQQLIQCGRPVVRLRLSQGRACDFVQAAYVLVHAGIAVAGLRGIDPLAMPGADRLREMQAAALADNGGVSDH